MDSGNDQEAKLALRLQRLIEANQTLAQVESVENLVPLLLALAREVIGAEASSFLVYNPDRQTLRFFTIKDEHISAAAEKKLKDSVEIPIGEGIAGWVARERRPLIVKDAQKDSRFYKKADKSTGFITRSILGVPVQYGDELLGVIEVLNPIDKDAFDDSDSDLLVSFANLASVAIIRARLLEERLHQQKMEIQMETAAKIQALFRPKPPEPGSGSHFWAVSAPARFVGGDLYDVIPMADGSWLVYVADVSDKGLPAALIMVALWYRIRSEANRHPDVGKLLEVLNKSLNELLEEEGYFVTIFIGQYWPDTGRMVLANGGHDAALKMRKNGCESVQANRGPSLGITCCCQYATETVMLEHGESILFTIDGVSEAMNPRGELFGKQRVVNRVKSEPGPPWGPGLMEAVKLWQADTEPNDDLTILEIWRVKD